MLSSAVAPTSSEASLHGAAAADAGGQSSPPALPPAPALEVAVSYGGAGAGETTDRGIYLRDPAQSSMACDVGVTLTPLWRSATRNEQRVSYQARLALQSSDPRWVAVPDKLLLMHGGRSFNVHVDPKRLLPGTVHYAEVRGYECLAPAVEAAALKSAAHAVAVLEGGVGDATTSGGGVAFTAVRPSERSWNKEGVALARKGVGWVAALLGPLVSHSVSRSVAPPHPVPTASAARPSHAGTLCPPPHPAGADPRDGSEARGAVLQRRGRVRVLL